MTTYDDYNMSKYKYEREYMFSMKSSEEIQLFLENQQQRLDLLAIRNKQKNTVIHHTSYHNLPQTFELYIKYYRKTLQIQGFTVSQIKQFTRCLLDQPNNQGYTAYHYASFRGNVKILKLLTKYEANVNLVNYQGMGVLHMAAYGDRPSSFLFFHDFGLDINIKDKKQATPLHFAAYNGSEKIVEYLIAQQNLQINGCDDDGQTPLHLASLKGNNKIVKCLLLAGANRQIKNKKQQIPLDISRQKQFISIQKMLDLDFSLCEHLKILCGAKNILKPRNKSFVPPFLFFIIILMGSYSFAILKFNAQWFLILYSSIFGISTILFLSLIIKRRVNKQKGNYNQLSESDKIMRICMFCIKKMKRRQQHCWTCGVCVSQYDHHCKWINNCVGKDNLFRFQCFIHIIFLLNLLQSYISASVVVFYFTTYQITLFHLRQWAFQSPIKEISIGIMILIVFICIVFIFPLFVLILVQDKNLLLGRTTYQRFALNQQSILTRQDDMSKSIDPPTFSLKNCFNMYMSERQISKYEGARSSSTTQSYLNILQ